MVPPQTPQIAHIMTQIHENDNNNKADKNPKEPISLDQLVKNIHRALGPDGGLDSEHIDANEILKLMEEYSSNATDWSKYTIFDHSRAYTRNLIDDGNGKVNKNHSFPHSYPSFPFVPSRFRTHFQCRQ